MSHTRTAASFALLCLAVAASGSRAAPSVGELYRAPVLGQIVLSPSGELLATVVKKKKSGDTLLVRRRDEKSEIAVFKQADGIDAVAWSDEGHLVTRAGRRTYVVTVSEAEGELRSELGGLRARGYFVHLLPTAGEDVLWGVDAGGASSVYRIPISELIGEKGAAFDASKAERRVAKLEDVIAWMADGRGNVRAAARIRGRSQRLEIWYRSSAEERWLLLLQMKDPSQLVIPVAIAENDRDLVVISGVDRDTNALFELSTETGRLGRELFSHPDADVLDVLVDYADNSLIAAVYERDGLREFHHFDRFRARYQRSLAHALPGVAASMISASEDRRVFLLLTRGPRDPGTYYVLDTTTNTATRVGRKMPWLDPEELADVEAIRVASTGGIEVEAFLARPRGAKEPPPLVVLPHGGPIAQRDTRTFQPLVQFLAAGGMAVLQVNYRGSSGRGDAFIEAGARQWGTGIEEDLEAAVDEVVRRGLVDGDRVCIAGGSYGGYSALISVIRSPERYRCAASLNGVTDLAFDASQVSERSRRFFTTFVGDPEDHEKLQSISPAYLASEIRVPILLVQGTEDRNVVPDHYYRMKNALEVFDKAHEAHLIRGGGHVPTRPEWKSVAFLFRKFLSEHLAPR